MRILLINPPRCVLPGNIWKVIDRSLPPLGLAYIASFLEENGIPVQIVDMQALGCSLAEVTAIAGRCRPEYFWDWIRREKAWRARAQ